MIPRRPFCCPIARTRLPRKASLPSLAHAALPVTLDDIRQARARIAGAIPASPCQLSHSLSQLAGAPLSLKLENLQRTGSFKERGALNRLLELDAGQRAAGVIAASAGNHAQGVAFHAARLGIRARIVMPLATPQVKVAATRAHGAEVLLHGAGYDEACEHALQLGGELGLVFLHPFDDPAVIAGQGTIGLELLEQSPGIATAVLPIGGGGLIGGVACALKESRPGMRVIGVEQQSLASMLRAREQGAPVTLPAADTIADGIAVRRAGACTLPLVERYVDEIVTVDDEEIASAILTLLEQEKTLAEGAGAAALAAVLQGKIELGGAATTVLVGGGNIDVTLLAKIIERGLVKDGRLLLLRVYLVDRPGALVQLAQVFAAQGANIVETVHNRAYYGVTLQETAIDVTLETRGAAHIGAIAEALRSTGFRFERIH